MAKYKGKSGRRIKDWHRRMVAAGDAEDSPDQRRMTFARREVKIPAERLQAPQENLDDCPRAEGMVEGFFPGGAIVRVEGEELLCGIAKTFRAPEGQSPLAVGDNVTLAVTRDDHHDGDSAGDRDRADAFIIARDPRSSALARPQPRSAKRTDRYDTDIVEKVIAANMDQLAVVAATRQPRLKHGLIDRFLIIAERGEMTPLLIVNKVDLARPDGALLDDFRELDVPVVLCSAETGEGLDALRTRLAGKRTVLAGASGVGKTTLINALVPSAQAETAAVRIKDERGRHTTTAAAVYDLPDADGMLIDTPGIRELAMALTADELPWYFPELEARAPACKFNDCTHTHEPHCAVIAAVEAGDIPPRRYQSYLRIRETIAGSGE